MTSMVAKAEGTVRFGLDGTSCEIDLSAAHAEELRKVLAPYARAGRKVTGVARRTARNQGKAAANGFSTNEVRDWAKANGVGAFSVATPGPGPHRPASQSSPAAGCTAGSAGWLRIHR
jgi:hypothetical protein